MCVCVCVYISSIAAHLPFRSRRTIPTHSLTMHQMSCARNNYYCTTCALVLPVRDKHKHLAIAHTQVTCVCGQLVEPTVLTHHKVTTCPQRLVPCRFCPLRIAHVDMFQHQTTCRMRMALCHHCQESMRAQEIRFHCLQKHGLDAERVEVGRDFS